MNPERDPADECIAMAFTTRYLFPVLFVMIGALIITGWAALKLPVDILLSWSWPWPWSLIQLATDAMVFLIFTSMFAGGVGIVAMTIVWKLLRILPSSTTITPLVPALSGPVPETRVSALRSWGLAALISVLAIIGAIVLSVVGWTLWIGPWWLLGWIFDHWGS